MEIFEFSTYRSYLVWKVGGEGTRTGMRQQIAKYLRVHSTFISHVLSGKADFSAEQIEDLNVFFEHSPIESDYLHLLVAHERAGTSRLKNRYAQQLRALVEKQKSIGKQFASTGQVSEQENSKFYSKIIYSLVLMGATIEQYSDNLTDLAIATHSTPQQVKEALEFLTQAGLLVKKQKDQTMLYRLGQQHVHLDRGSNEFRNNHANFRLFAMQNFDRAQDSDILFSSAFSASRDDFEKIKELQRKTLKKQAEIIKNSKEEELFIFNFDLMQLIPRT